MAINMGRLLGMVVLGLAWTPFLGCEALQVGGSTDGTNDNSTDNTNDNTVDNTNDNSADNTNDFAGDDIGDNGDESSANLAVFNDPDTPFSTSDVYDVDEEIVQFDTSTNSIIWAADGIAYQEGLWTVNDVFLAGGFFQVRFGTKDGERRAYFTETGPATICQIEPVGGGLSISPTNVTVPQE